jgi:hypothetical protein
MKAQNILDRDLQPLRPHGLDDKIAGSRPHGRDDKIDGLGLRLDNE